VTAKVPIELWLLDRDQQRLLLEHVEAVDQRLSTDEFERAKAMLDERLAKRWLTGRTALRLLLEKRCGHDFRRQAFVPAPGGRPTLPAGFGVDFSVADSDPYLLIAITAGEVAGVDIEVPRKMKLSQPHVDRMLVAAAALGGRTTMALQAWTRIEALAKALGQTLAATLPELGIQGTGSSTMTLDEVERRTRALLVRTGVAVADLSLSGGLVGALAGPAALMATAPPVHLLDDPTLRDLAAGRHGCS
jgi:phosphopantetheinyl transferase